MSEGPACSVRDLRGAKATHADCIRHRVAPSGFYRGGQHAVCRRRTRDYGRAAKFTGANQRQSEAWGCL
jgi:hypothetical protein